ncbi:MAG: hypothetical protein LBO80_07560, partial [Treponema sp.]|nr:hypothetical protein [Treponema sp.]
MAAVSPAGRQNITAVPFSDVVNGELVLLPDLFLQKTKMKNPGASSWVSSFCKVWIVCGVHTNIYLAHYNSITPLTL